MCQVTLLWFGKVFIMENYENRKKKSTASGKTLQRIQQQRGSVWKDFLALVHSVHHQQQKHLPSFQSRLITAKETSSIDLRWLKKEHYMILVVHRFNICTFEKKCSVLCKFLKGKKKNVTTWIISHKNFLLIYLHY